MKMLEFEGLEQAEQLDLLYTEGTFVGKLRGEEYIRLLYQLHDFYAEVTYLRYRFTAISVRCSDATDILEPYLSQIKF
ncbi:MAG: hypothetical protein JWP69_2411 [Flaviaesturariibacter sp.]|nr:hypothetical protein [Flaviaesturariibacter sp.]